VYAEERHQVILQQARRDSRVDVAGLAADLDVTTETVRRDLTTLERQGLVRRVHGGAIPVERLRIEPTLAARDSHMQTEKERIAKAALDEVPEGGSILLDAGTTTARLADLLPAERELTVVTNALPIAMMLAARPNLTVLSVGGRVRGRTLAGVDDWAVRILHDTFVDVAFVATNGISAEHGLTTPDMAEAAVKRAMLASGHRTVLLADHTKVGQGHFARFGSLEDVDVFITDTGLDAETAAQLETLGPRVVRA
jgi:DeoR family fructose operon transcriptional repressor